MSGPLKISQMTPLLQLQEDTYIPAIITGVGENFRIPATLFVEALSELSDLKYGRLGEDNDWMADNYFYGDVHIILDPTDPTHALNLGFANETYGRLKEENAWEEKNTYLDEVTHPQFQLTTDFSGTNWQMTPDGDLNIRKLVVRDTARFRELIIDQLGVIAGSQLLSSGRGKIKDVAPGNNQVTIESPLDGATRHTYLYDDTFLDLDHRLEYPTSFVVGDFFWIKVVDVTNGIFAELRGQVTHIEGSTLTLDTTVPGGSHEGGATDISIILEGDVIVQRGHPTDPQRQSLIYQTVSDSDAPVTKYLRNINSLAAFDQVSNITTQTGNLSYLASEYAGIQHGDEGFFSSKAFFTDSILVGDLDKSGHYMEYANGELEVKGKITVTGGNAATKEELEALEQEGVVWPSREGIYGYWSMDQTQGSQVYDNSGNTRHGTVEGTPDWETDGAAGAALRLNRASDGHITVPQKTWADNEPYTFSALVKWEGSGATDFIIFCGDKSGVNSQLYLANTLGNANRVIFRTHGGVSYDFGNIAPAMDDGKWHHIGFTMSDDRHLKIYKDGEKIVDHLLPSSSSFRLNAVGKGISSAGYSWNGLLDEVRVYNKELSEMEMRAMWRLKVLPDNLFAAKIREDVEALLAEFDIPDLEGLGDLAWEDLVEVAKLGDTVIQGGYINTELVDSDIVRAAIITTSYIQGQSFSFTQGWVGGLTIASEAIYGLNAGMSSQGSAATSVRYWAGTTYENRANADWRVTQAGKMYAAGAEISGHVEAETGRFGNWSIVAGGMVNNDDDAYIITRNHATSPTLEARIGNSVFPSSAGIRGLSYFALSLNDLDTGWGVFSTAKNTNASGGAYAAYFKGERTATGQSTFAAWIDGPMVNVNQTTTIINASYQMKYSDTILKAVPQTGTAVITLPQSPIDGMKVTIIKDAASHASHYVQINHSGDGYIRYPNFQNVSSYIIENRGGSVTLQYFENVIDGETVVAFGGWYIISENL